MTRDHDDVIVRRVHRTLAAVADATPIHPPLADDLRELQEIVRANATASTNGAVASTDPAGFADPAEPIAAPLRPRQIRRDGHGRSSAGRRLALAAAVLAVALAAAATWMLRPNPGSPPAVQTDDDPPAVALDAGWLPDGLADFEEAPVRTSTRGLDVELDAAAYRPENGGGTLVMAAGDMPDAATAGTVAGALTRLTRADATDDHSVSGQMEPGGPGIATVAWGDISSEQTIPLTDQVAEGVRPADARATGVTTIPVRVDWAPGIAPSVTTRYGDPVMASSCLQSAPVCPDAWVEVATTTGELPEPDVLDALLPGNQQVELGTRSGWISTQGGEAGITLVVWQEAEGVIASVMAHGFAEQDVQRIAHEVTPSNVDGYPVMEAVPLDSWTTLDGTELTIERWVDSWRGAAGGPTTLCWRVRLPTDEEPAIPVCGGVDGTFHEGRRLGRSVLYGTIVGPEVANVQLAQGSMESFPPVPLGDGGSGIEEKLVFVVGSEEAARNEVVSALDAGGNMIGQAEVVHE